MAPHQPSAFHYYSPLVTKVYYCSHNQPNKYSWKQCPANWQHINIPRMKWRYDYWMSTFSAWKCLGEKNPLNFQSFSPTMHIKNITNDMKKIAVPLFKQILNDLWKHCLGRLRKASTMCKSQDSWKMLCVFLYTCNNASSLERSLVINGKNSANGLFLTVSKWGSVWPANVRTGSDARTSRSWPQAQATLYNFLIGSGHAGAGISMDCASAKTCWLCSELFAHIRKSLAGLSGCIIYCYFPLLLEFFQKYFFSERC